MKQSRFPDPDSADDDGLLCIGGDLEPETLIEAYSLGVFPWPQEGLPLLWFYPASRGVLFFDELHWPRRFLQALRKPGYEITFDNAFRDIIRACARTPRKGEAGTWILPEMEKAYLRLHELGFAHSTECWLEGQLVGGAYGIWSGGIFSGESMFHRDTDSGKRALFYLCEKLRAAGVEWIDVQMVTPVLKTLGARYVNRTEYKIMLQRARERSIPTPFNSSRALP